MSDGPERKPAIDALQKIKESEAEARKIIQEAREKTSVKIIQDAHKDAEQIKERMIGEARQKAQEKKRSIIQEAEHEVKKIAEEIQAEIDRLRERSVDARADAIVRVAASIRDAIEEGQL